MVPSDLLPCPNSTRPAKKIAARTLAESAQTATPVAVLLLDLDYFKQVNDRYGHAAGDTVLRATVEAWQAQLRDRDALGRIGGEEFAVVCAGTGPEQARAIAACQSRTPPA